MKIKEEKLGQRLCLRLQEETEKGIKYKNVSFRQISANADNESLYRTAAGLSTLQILPLDRISLVSEFTLSEENDG